MADPLTLNDVRGRATLPLWPDTAELLGLSKDSVYRAAVDLPFVRRVGHRWIVAVPALLRWLGEEPSTDDEPANPGEGTGGHVDGSGIRQGTPEPPGFGGTSDGR